MKFGSQNIKTALLLQRQTFLQSVIICPVLKQITVVHCIPIIQTVAWCGGYAEIFPNLIKHKTKWEQHLTLNTLKHQMIC
jgi:hypothetical protein